MIPKKYSISELELLLSMGVGKFPISFERKKIYLDYDNQALEPILKRNWCNKPYSAKLTRSRPSSTF